jgi:hypothetical protein
MKFFQDESSKKKTAIESKEKKMYTPEGYLNDPPDAKCPYCGKTKKNCSYVNSLSRAWSRSVCKTKNCRPNNSEDSE